MKNIRLNRHLQAVRECIGTRKSLFFTNYSYSVIHFCSNALAEGRIARPSSVFTFVTNDDGNIGMHPRDFLRERCAF